MTTKLEQEKEAYLNDLLYASVVVDSYGSWLQKRNSSGEGAEWLRFGEEYLDVGNGAIAWPLSAAFGPYGAPLQLPDFNAMLLGSVISTIKEGIDMDSTAQDIATVAENIIALVREFDSE